MSIALIYQPLFIPGVSLKRHAQDWIPMTATMLGWLNPSFVNGVNSEPLQGSTMNV